MRRMWKKKTTGLLSLIAVFIRPLAEYGSAGIASFSPGVCMTTAAGDCECSAPSRPPPPILARSTIGRLTLPP